MQLFGFFSSRKPFWQFFSSSTILSHEFSPPKYHFNWKLALKRNSRLKGNETTEAKPVELKQQFPTEFWCVLHNFGKLISTFLIYFYNLCTSWVYYRVCHGFRLTKRVAYFGVDFYIFKIEHLIWRQLGQ
jgi:hypothetical protein